MSASGERLGRDLEQWMQLQVAPVDQEAAARVMMRCKRMRAMLSELTRSYEIRHYLQECQVEVVMVMLRRYVNELVQRIQADTYRAGEVYSLMYAVAKRVVQGMRRHTDPVIEEATELRDDDDQSLWIDEAATEVNHAEHEIDTAAARQQFAIHLFARGWPAGLPPAHDFYLKERGRRPKSAPVVQDAPHAGRERGVTSS